jgi:hypothetical protein
MVRRGIVAAFRQANPDDDWKALMGICGAVCLKPSQVLRLAKYDVMAPTVEKAKEILAARGLEPDPSIEFEGDNILTHVEDPSVVVKDAYEWVLEGKPIKWSAVSKGISMRPWNTGLKVLCWKIGECFVYVSGKEDAYYGEVYSKRKKFETARNEGGYNATAAEILKSKRIGEDTVAFEYYSKGKFPPAHVHARAKRYAVKLFLSHFHHVAYKEKSIWGTWTLFRRLRASIRKHERPSRRTRRSRTQSRICSTWTLFRRLRASSQGSEERPKPLEPGAARLPAFGSGRCVPRPG